MSPVKKNNMEEPYEELPPGTSLYAHLAAGALAGIAEHTIMFPFDAIKVLDFLTLDSYASSSS